MGSVEDLIRLAAIRPGRAALTQALALWATAEPAVAALDVQVDGADFFRVGAAGTDAESVIDGVVRIQVAGAPPGAARALAALVSYALGPENAAYRRTLHDLRGALAVVLGQSEMLADGLRGPLPERAVPAVAALRRQAERAADLTDQLTLGESGGGLAHRGDAR